LKRFVPCEPVPGVVVVVVVEVVPGVVVVVTVWKNYIELMSEANP
jgi:hypothetical protein